MDQSGRRVRRKSLSAALTIYHESTLKRDDLLRMPVPENDAALEAFLQAVHEYNDGDSFGKYGEIVQRIDEMVARAFGLEGEEATYIQEQMREDPFLKRLKPKLPFSGRKKKGLLEGLASSSRYL